MFCHFRFFQHHFLALSANCISLYKTAFSAGDEQVLTFSHWPHHFLAIFRKGHQFVQNSVFCPRSERTVIFALGAPLFNSFQQSALLARDQHVLSFSHWVQHVLAFFSKVHEIVQDSVISQRSARFTIFALCTPLISDFQQRARVCTKQRFQPEIFTYCHFCTGCTTF